MLDGPTERETTAANIDREDREWWQRLCALRTTLIAVLDGYSVEDREDVMLQMILEIGRSGHGYSLEAMMGTLEEGRDLEAGL